MVHQQGASARSCRSQTLTSWLALVSCLCGLLSPTKVLGQETLPAAARQEAEKEPTTSGTPGIQERFLRVEPKFTLMMHVGNKVTQNGKVIDTGFSFLIPDSAVNGSMKAMAHLSHARIAQAAAFAAFLATTGLLVGAEVIRQQHDGRWTNPSEAMALGSVLTFLSSVVFAHWRDWETFAAVNSYNHDLVTGHLDH
jgi:hypothetical protein